MRATTTRIQKAARSLDELRSASDHFQAVDAFEDCVTELRSIPDALTRELTNWARRPHNSSEKSAALSFCKDVRSFEAAADDDLLKWIKNYRDEALHAGHGASMAWSMHVDELRTEDLEPGPPGASLGIGPGIYWITDQGTTREHRVPARPRPGTPTAVAANRRSLAVPNPPFKLCGNVLPLSICMLGQPVALCSIALEHWRSVTDEVSRRWPSFAGR